VTITKDDISRFARLCEMLGSPSEQERATAALKASEQLRKWELTWTELLSNPMHLLLANPEKLRSLISKAWEEKQEREEKERVERRWTALHQRAEALRSSHGMLLLKKENALLDEVTKRRFALQLAEQVLLELEKEIVLNVRYMKTKATSADEHADSTA
jgi:hypothetical protein